MAGYTSRNFLSLTIPSILVLSILWFIKKKNSKEKSVNIENQIITQCQNNTLVYPMKLTDKKEANSGEVAEMQLKDPEPATSEKQCQFSNGVVAHNSKTNGKLDVTSRLHEKSSSCSVDYANGWTKDKSCLSDSSYGLTNGIKELCLNDNAAVSDVNFACAISKACADLDISNSFAKANSVEKFSEGSLELERGSLKKDGIFLNSELKLKDRHPEGTSSKAAKLPDLMNGLNESFSNGSAFKMSDCLTSKLSSDTSAMEKELTSDEHASAISNLSIMHPLSSKISFTDEHSFENSADEHSSQSGDSDHSDMSLLSSQQDEVADGRTLFSMDESENIESVGNENIVVDTVEEVTIVADNVAGSVISSVSIVTVPENLTLPLDVVTYPEHMSPPIDYMVSDSSELLPLPVDYIADVQGEMLQSPGAKYCDSLGSNDSGRGASEIQFTLEAEPHLVYMVYEFEILPEDCGRLIGRSGRHVKFINKQTNANIVIKKHPCLNDRKICTVTGSESEINAALKMIRKRFPIEHFPSVTLAQINSIPISTLFCPETLKLPLPEGGVFEALLCSTVNAGHFFLQQPTHPTFHQLPPLTNAMNALYKQTEAPILEDPTKGNICAAEIAGGWYRAEVDEVYEQAEECRLKFLDYGGYADVPRTSIRKIKCDFMSIPFQATECFLAGVMPSDENGWSREATLAFEQLAQGQLIQGLIVAYSESRVPYLNLYKITGISSVFINQELVNSGVAKGIALPQ